MELTKNQKINLTITDIGNEGEGIGFYAPDGEEGRGMTIFVKDTLPGDVIEATVLKSKKTYAYAKADKLLVPSESRTEPFCPVSRACGGCQIQSMRYADQLVFKARKVRNNLVHLGGFDEALIESISEPIIGMEEPTHYRNKAQFPVGTDKNGNPIVGFYAGRTHSIIPCMDCGLGVAENAEVLKRVLQYMRFAHVKAYDETTGKGLIRHILIRKGFATKELMVCLVINAERLPKEEKLVELLNEIEHMTSVSVSVNRENTNVIMGTGIRVLSGLPYITDTLRVPGSEKEISFRISPLSFYQVNPVQTARLYGTALEYAALTGNETVWDLYCGIGTISLFLAGSAGKVCGVEIIPQAIENARENAERNGFTNTEFYVGKAEEVLPEYYAKNRDADLSHPDVIVVDPPRKGMDSVCVDTILKMQPDRIVYVSCDSATLARDCKLLTEGGYELKRVRPVDMFPQSVHVETVALMSKVK